MINKSTYFMLLSVILILSETIKANFITANPGNYQTYADGLQAGDTLFLTAGTYPDGLNLYDHTGTPSAPIVITGVEGAYTTIFLGDATQSWNTIQIGNSSYVVIKNLKIDGQNIDYVDAVNAKGSWADHITIENVYIINNGGSIDCDNQTVGISTKCTAWNWIIRGNIIIGAGTGMYFGNSDGTMPFVGGLIENNVVINTRGYNLQIKHQKDGERAKIAGTSTDYQKTIIRYNVWSKDSGSTPIDCGDGSRPCVLLGAFPSTSFGANDTYEVYGNFFYNNPTEALIQITGNTALYSNVFVNNANPLGFITICITNQNGFKPRNINVFHNTVLSNTTSGGLWLYSPNSSYQQHCYANAVFSASAIGGFANELDDVSDTYANAATYINSPSTTLASLDMYPKAGKLQGTLTSNTLFKSFTDFDKDFNGNTYDWTYRGAYSGAGANPGWHLQLDIMPVKGIPTETKENKNANGFLGMVYPNPTNSSLNLDINLQESEDVIVTISDLESRTLKTIYSGEMHSGVNKITNNVSDLPDGFYLISVKLKDRIINRKILIIN
ncbi:MAG: T9SS type A sorting domain-containing protein [Bacteroidales bacterium]|nr:T9SS type A sorting domain-containing protein [Bacteroidales bacterium]